ncbi:MAG: PKD domain-containing protein [Saprospiraceae bacterium]
MKRICILLFVTFFINKIQAQQSVEPLFTFPISNIGDESPTALDLKNSFSKVKVIDFDLKDLYNYFQSSDRSGKIKLMLPQAPITVSWVEKDLVADDYQLIALGDNGERKVVRSMLKTYEGYIVDAPQYAVAITISNDFLNIMIEQPNGNYYIEQIERFSKTGRGNFVYYNSMDFIDKGNHTCGTSESDELKTRQQIEQQVPSADRTAGICYRVEVSVASDQLMFNRYGSVSKVEAHTLAVWNNVTTNYKKSFNNDYEFKIIKQLVATSGGALPVNSTTDASVVLGSFRDWAVKNNGFGDQRFDIAQMWTTRDISGGVIGIAYVGVVCTESRAQLIEDFSPNSELLRVVVAHETGHNFSMTHDAQGSPYVMAPTAQITKIWSSQSAGQINTYVNNLFTKGNNCLSSCANPGQKPVVDFTNSTSAVCTGSKVSFSDNSTNDPTAWLWTFPGGTPSQSISENPQVVYTAPGTYDVTLRVTNAYGSTTLVKKSLIFAGANSGNYCKFPAAQNSKAGIRYFKLANMSNTSGSVQEDGNRYKDYSCSKIASMQPSTEYECELTVGDCSSSLYEGIQLYADYNNDNDFEDIGEFLGYSSFLYCGAFSFKITTPPSPVENTILRLRLISSSSKTLVLDPCTPPAEGQVEDYGIIFQCPTPCGPSGKLPLANFASDLNAVCQGGLVQFRDRSTYNPTQWEWTFPGGNPSSSSEENPKVTYSNNGTYDVSLKVTNTTGTHSIEKKKFISVDVVNNVFCTANGTLNTKAGLKSFKLANVSKQSGSAQQDGNRYMDFSCTQVAIMQPSTTYDIEIDLGDCATSLRESFRVYIDYNNDGDFNDVGEFVAGNQNFLLCGVQTYGPAAPNNTLRFTTPANLVELKVLRLRVITQASTLSGADGGNPCYIPTNGQVEDYGVLFRSSFAINADVKNSDCNKYDNGHIKLNPNGGTPPYNFDWNINAYDGKTEALNLKPGDYSVTISDNGGLFISRKFKITEPDSIVYGALVNRAQCSDSTGTIELAPVGGGGGAPYSFAWSHSPTANGPLVENLYGGLYVVTITDGKGCNAVAKIAVDSTIMPDLSLIEDMVVCKGQSVTLTAKKGLKYLWSNGATTPSITVTTAGKYYVTATNGECENSTSADVNFIDFTPKIIGDTKVCQGNEAFLIARDAITYLWSTGQTDDRISVFPQMTTTYSLTATFLGCSKVLPWKIDVTDSNVRINSNRAEICAGESIVLSSSDGKSYTWNNGQTGSSITVSPTTSTTYSFGIPGGVCPYVVAKEIKVGSLQAAPSVVSLGNITFCKGGETVLVAPPDMSTYIWSNGSTTQTTKITSSGSYTVTVTKDGCSAKSTPTVITVNPLPTPVVSSGSGASAICDGASLQLSVNANYDAYFWSSGEATKSITVSTANAYVVTVIDGNGCAGASTPFAVVTSAKPSVNVGADVTICAGENAVLTGNVGGGASPYSFDWSPTPGLSSTNLIATTASPTVTTTYTLKVVDSKGCLNTDAIIVNVSPLPGVPSISVNKNVLSSTSSTGNQWYLNGQLIPGATSQNYTISKDGKYSVKVTNALNCSATSLEVTVKFIIGTEDLLTDNLFKIYPNPIEDFFVVQLKSKDARIMEISDVLGRVITGLELDASDSFELRVSTALWSKGTYYIHVKDKDLVIIGLRKIVKL